jgi:spermidine synthase
MIPWELLDTAQIPGNNKELRLYRRDAEFSIRVDACELMNSRAHGSEDALAELACAKISHLPRPRLLIGGLGMGYTMAASLKRLGPDASVVVAELVPAVVEWNRGLLAHLTCHPLQDKRVTVRMVDVARILQEKSQTYDAILLDVDNGPNGLTSKSNDWLYSQEGLEASFAALRPAGILAVWAASHDKSFSRRLKLAGYEVTEVHARARGLHGGGHHTIWIAVA